MGIIISQKHYKANGSLEKFKVKLFMQGYSQIDGFDLLETFAQQLAWGEFEWS